MKRIELRIMGGFGNQLYQYSAAKYIEKKYGAEEVVLDSGEYATYKIRNLEIDQLLHNDIVSVEEIKSKKNFFFREGYHVYQKLFRIISKKRPHQIVLRWFKEKYLCAYISCDLTRDLKAAILHMYGYFVSADIALSVKNELMQELWLDANQAGDKYLAYSNLTNLNECIAISIRCAEDYVKNKWPICSSDFYCKGLDYIIDKKGMNCPILIFADDIDKVKKENWFSNYDNVTYVEGLSVCESFELLRSCSHYVCSNSSFSWWGAFLSYSASPIRIIPNKVFSGDSNDIDNLTFYKGLTILDYNTGELVI